MSLMTNYEYAHFVAASDYENISTMKTYDITRVTLALHASSH